MTAGHNGRTSLGLGQGSAPWPNSPEAQQESSSPALPPSSPKQTVQRRSSASSAGAVGSRPRFGGGLARPMTRVRFWLNWHVQYGQSIRVVGSHDNLGAPQQLSGTWVQRRLQSSC